MPRLRELTEASHGSQVVDALAPRPGELVIRKTQASAFFGTHLAGVLLAKGVDTIVMAGCTTSGCVRASAIDAMSSNFRLVVASDCVGDRALGPHEANLFDIGQKYGDLLSSSAIMDDDRGAGGGVGASIGVAFLLPLAAPFMSPPLSSPRKRGPSKHRRIRTNLDIVYWVPFPRPATPGSPGMTGRGFFGLRLARYRPTGPQTWRVPAKNSSERRRSSPR